MLSVIFYPDLVSLQSLLLWIFQKDFRFLKTNFWQRRWPMSKTLGDHLNDSTDSKLIPKTHLWIDQSS